MRLMDKITFGFDRNGHRAGTKTLNGIEANVGARHARYGSDTGRSEKSLQQQD